MTSAQTRYLSSSLPVRYVLLFVNHLKYCLNPTRKNLLINFSFFYASPPERCKFWTLPIGSEPSMLAANSNVANLRGRETGVKPLVTTPLRYDLCLLAVYPKYDNIIMISFLTVYAVLLEEIVFL